MQLRPLIRKASEIGIGLTAIATLVLAGCGGGGSSSSGGGSSSSVQEVTTTITPYKGRFSNGQVRLKDANGNSVALRNGSGSINASGVASVTFADSVAYPLTVDVSGEYIDETTGASAVIADATPLQGMIPTASDVAATSGIPVTAITHMARAMLPAGGGFSAASAVAAITGASSSVLGVSSYSQAMLPPVFDAQGKTSDPTTLKLAALANVIGQQGTGADLGAKLRDVANKLAAGSAVTAVIPQNSFDTELAAVNATTGVKAMRPTNATGTVTITPIILPVSGMRIQIDGAIPTCTSGQVLKPSPTGLQCVADGSSGGGSTGSTCIDKVGSGTFRLADVNGGAFPASISAGGQLILHITTLTNSATSSYSVAFDTATTPTTVTPSAVNLTTSTLTVTIPQGATGGVRITDTCANNSAYQTGVFQIAQAAPAAPGVTATVASTTQINLSWNAVPGATRYRIYSSTTAGQSVQAMTPINAGAMTTALTVSDTGLTTGLTYYYKVVAYNADSVSGPASVEVSATPSAAGGGTGTLVVGLMGGAVQGTALTIANNAGVVTTLAGSGTAAFADGTGTNASFSSPHGITTDGTNLYVADSVNGRIRKIVISTGEVSTLAATLNFSPNSITTDGINLYVTDTSNHSIHKIVIATGAVTTLAGSNATAGFADSTGTAAAFRSPAGITTDGTNLYVADANNYRIRKIVIATGVVTTLAGSGTAAFADGTGAAAAFRTTTCITTDGTHLYVADTGNYRIRKIVIATGEVTTLAGRGTAGFANGTGTAAAFNSPLGITTDGTNLYVADTNNGRIRKIVIATGEVTTLAGSGSWGYFADGTGTAATFHSPHGITTDGTNLYVADWLHDRIRKIQ
ncbi:MAG: hypothetical protein WC742_11645 [Gallionellaceae bacterium]|jgi:sugar lactone lactonase YvrE